MKRLALVAVAVLAVAACGKKDEAATDTTMPAAATTPMTDTSMHAMDTSMKTMDTSMKAVDTLSRTSKDTMISAHKTTTVTHKP